MKKISLLLTLVLASGSAFAQQLVLAKSSADHYRAKVAQAPRKAEVRDEYGAITAPAEGVEKVFTRQGGVVVPVGFDVSEGQQKGNVTVVFCEDGTVYMKHPLSETLEHTNLNPNIWIKGTLKGDIISFPSQVIGYSTTFRSPISIAMGTMDLNHVPPTAVPDRSQDIVFKVKRDGKILELQNTDKNHVLGAFYDIDDDSYYYWDYNTQLIADTSNEHAAAVTPPAGMSSTKYIAAGYDATELYDPDVEASYAIGNVTFSSQLGFVGRDAYLGNFSFYGLNHWIKGELKADGTVVFPKEQYITTLAAEHYDLYFYALPHGSTSAADATDLVLTYDPVKHDYVSNQDLFISYEKMGSSLDKAECLENFRLISYNDVEPAPIYDAPKGYRQLSYLRYGKCYSTMSGWWNAEQVPDYSIDVAYSPDGKDVYMLSPIGAAQLDYWVKGTIEDDGKLHVPTHQWVQQDADYGDIRTGVFGIKWVNKSRFQYTYEWLPDVKEVTFSIDEDGFLTLDPLGPDQVDGEMPPIYTYGMVRGTDEYSMAGLMDAYTIYTPIEGSEVIIGDGDDEPGTEYDVDISGLCPGEKRNSFGIITDPGTGTEYTYSRAGGNYTYQSDDIAEGTQSGVIHIVETDDGYVYMQQPLSTYSKAYAATAWIKGVKREAEYIFPKGQPISHDDYWESNLVVFMGKYDSADGTFMPNKQTDIVFSISDDSKVLTLQYTNNRQPLGLFYDDDDAWVGYGDYNTVLSYKAGGHVEEKVEPSWKAERLNYTITANDLEMGPVGYNAVIAFDGDNDVYLGNFSFWLDYEHESNGKYVWIKGKRRDDGSLFFPREQYLYTYNEQGKDYDLFFYGCTSPVEGAWSPADLVLTYNEAADMYVAQQDILLTWGRIGTSIPRAEQLSGAIFTRDQFEGNRPYIITEQPKGKLCRYNRSGFAFGLDGSSGMIYDEPQDGMTIDLVFSDDGKYVYMHNPVSKTLLDSWVSGTVDEEDNLHFPLFQWLDYNEDFGYGVRTAACVLVEQGNAWSYYMVPNVAEMSFTLDRATGAYSLDRLEGIDYTSEAPRLIYGCYWTNDNTWTGFGDFDSVYTPVGSEGMSVVTTPKLGETYYDFQGRVARPTKPGLYIQGGRKMMVK